MLFLHDLWTNPVLLPALLAGVLCSVACGVVGSYVVVRRISYIAGGISHCVLGGLGAAVYLQRVHHWTWLNPLLGATFAALLSAMIIGLVSLRAKEREDTVISALWAIGMAIGIVFIKITPGVATDLTSYLIGNILIVGRNDLILMGVLDVVVLALAIAFFNQFRAVCFDEEFARLRGLNVEFYYLLLLALIALTVVLMISMVGVVLVIALLTLPVAIAGHFSRSLAQLMVVSVILSTVFTVGGVAVSYAPDLPAGATTILLAGGAYLVTIAGAWAIRRARRSSSSAVANAVRPVAVQQGVR